MKHFLVTGGCGFIGSNLCKFLNKKGLKITVLDDLSVGKYENIRKINNLEFVHSKIQDFNFNNLENLSGVFHLAAQTNINYSVSNFFKSSQANIMDSLKIIDFCSLNRIKLVYASSSAIYGNLSNGIENGQIDLINPYSVDKYLMEQYCLMAQKVWSLSSYGLRFFNVYGPGQDGRNPYSGVISIFIESLLNKKDIHVFGGKQLRDFIFVEDIVKGLWSAQLFLEKKQQCSVSNLLTGKSISIQELLNLIINQIGKNSKIYYEDYVKGDAMMSNGSTQLMKKELEISEFTDINRGLEQTINWYKTLVSN